MALFTSLVIGYFSVLAVVSCQVVELGKCPDVKVQENFDLTKYLGRWYENRRYSNLFSLFSNCITAEYTALSETSVRVNNTGWKYLSKYYDNAIGEAIVMADGKLGVRFSEFQPYGDYWVLSTDYTTYSIVWSCMETPTGPIQFNSQYLWILSRSPDGVPDEQLQNVMDILKSYNINSDIRKLKPTAQTGCPGRNYNVDM